MSKLLLLCALLFALPAQAGDIDPTLIGGTVADPKDWPASPWIGNCSSTLIGENVLLTAAHCVRNGGSVSFTIGNSRYSGSCSHHPSYRGNATADWALCWVSRKVEGIEFEVVASIDEVQCARGTEFLWTGYGCTRWGSRLDGRFRTGSVKTISCPRGYDYDTVTRGSVALCSGDSGGGGYIVRDGVRKVVGVNSRSNTRDTSYVSSTYTQAFQNWAKEWAKSRGGLKICGLHADAARCKGVDLDPNKCAQEKAEVESAKDVLKVAEDKLKACMQAK